MSLDIWTYRARCGPPDSTLSEIVGAIAVGKATRANMADILTRLASCFQTAFKTDPSTISVDTMPDEVEGWDSLGHTELVSAIEKEFGLSFDIDEIMEMEDVESIVRVLTEKLN